MHENALRKQLMKHQIYLYKLYVSKPKDKRRPKETKNLLKSGTFHQLQTICRVLHKTCNGFIPMKKETFEEICSKKLLNRLRNGIERKKSLSEKVKEKDKALLFLNSIAIILPTLLKPLFVKEKSSSLHTK